ncbi:Retrovirus-related Pol polyprotein from transposon TNT 1-94 [Senna tora]|uniref:Retrovirus-related Pol polyprotein from transposon TNT 1-94 n=1 Tax=Senna tora TaxID=362788 RepID=A0A834TJ31_9FABA|nr:Retrovirus-related Pol polyprotein from transposon TNT 1-94 [Senna tora]
MNGRKFLGRNGFPMFYQHFLETIGMDITSTEQGTKRMIGHAKERNGLYYLDTCNKGHSVQNSALQPQQPSDPPQISPDPDLNLQTNQTLDSTRPLQVYSRRKAPPPTSESVQSSPSEPQYVEVIDSSNPHTHDYDVPIALRNDCNSELELIQAADYWDSIKSYQDQPH